MSLFSLAVMAFGISLLQLNPWIPRCRQVVSKLTKGGTEAILKGLQLDRDLWHVACTAMISCLCWYNSASMAGCPRNGPAWHDFSCFFNVFHMRVDWIPHIGNFAMRVQLSWLLSFSGRRPVACMLPRMRGTKLDYGSEKSLSESAWMMVCIWVAGWMLLVEFCWQMLVASKRGTLRCVGNSYSRLLPAPTSTYWQPWFTLLPQADLEHWTSECSAICWPSDARGHSPGMSV